MLDLLQEIDTSLLLWLNGLHTPLLDEFMMMFTGRWLWVPMYATILLILFRAFPRRQALLWSLAIILCITLADQVCASLLRPIFQRLRPANIDNPISPLVHIVDGYRGGRYGFPSCHGANSFALATILALIVRQRRFAIFVFGWAALNSYTRIYLGVHYPGDILTGAAIGSAISAGVYALTRRVARASASKGRDMEVIFARRAGMLAPVMGTPTINLRIFDILPALGGATALALILTALL